MSITRKNYTVEFKESIVKAAIETGNASLVARQHGLSRELVYRWVRQSKESSKAPKNNIKTNIDSL